jgi:predicted transposase YdaD
MISNTAETGYYALTPEEARQERKAGRQEGLQAGIQEGRQEVLAMLSEAERDKIRQRLVSQNAS